MTEVDVIAHPTENDVLAVADFWRSGDVDTDGPIEDVARRLLDRLEVTEAASQLRGAVEALRVVSEEAIRDPQRYSSAWLIPAGAMDLVRQNLGGQS